MLMPNYFTTGVFSSEYRVQLLATLGVTIITYCNGIGLGWFAPIVIKLQSTDDTPLDFVTSVEEASWIGALVCMGGVVGILFFSMLLDVAGRKPSIYLLSVPHMCFWLLIYFAPSVEYLYAGRFASGITGGGTWVVIPIFVGEIADPNVRGRLTSLFTLTLNAGMLTGYIVSAYMPYHIIPLTVMLLPLLYLFIETYFPETPQYLLRGGHEEQAKDSLKFYMNYKESTEKETETFNQTFGELKIAVKKQNALKDASTWKDFFTKRAINTISISVTVMSISGSCGNLALLSYMSSIFGAVKSNINPDTNTILIGFVQVVGSYIATIMVDKFGRKLLLIVSTATTGICLAAFGMYAFFAQETNFDLSPYNPWLPLLIMTLIILTANAGLIPVPAILMVEILPPKIREQAVAFTVILTSFLTFFVLKVFPPFMHAFGVSASMWAFASIAAFGLLYITIFVPETKGKSMNTDDDGK